MEGGRVVIGVSCSRYSRWGELKSWLAAPAAASTAGGMEKAEAYQISR